jgi:CheY-like chemotaxis protein
VVGIVSSGWEAVEQAAALQPDLVLMDIKLMGPMDGVSATQRIQTQSDVPVVYLTSYSDDETLKRVLHSQPYGYLIKPFGDQELRNAINKALYQHRLGRQDIKGRPV